MICIVLKNGRPLDEEYQEKVIIRLTMDEVPSRDAQAIATQSFSCSRKCLNCIRESLGPGYTVVETAPHHVNLPWDHPWRDATLVSPK